MTPENEELAAELAVIETQVGRTRDARMAAERAAQGGGAVEIGIADAERDRDAKNSPEVTKLRDQTRLFWLRLEKAWRENDARRLRLARLAEHGIEVAGPGGFARGAALLALLDEECEQRDDVRRLLDALGGPAVEVPHAVSLDDARTALGERYVERVNAWQELAAKQVAQDARARSGSKRHENEGIRRG